MATATKSAKRCPVTVEEFSRGAKPLAVTVNGQVLYAQQRQFSTGSFGWYLSGKVTVEVDGMDVPVQVGMSLTCIGSKPEAAGVPD